MTIFGERNPINTVPGSAHVITEVELEEFNYTDIMRTLASIPGVYILEEDGYGLRPNVGMRGTGQNRSEKITIMEDGILAAPAPYASPSAYYFPTAGRMQGIEILKGSSTVKYGPRTTGGIVNLISRQIPEEQLAGKVDVALGEDGFGKLHTYAGGQGERIGGVVDLYRYQASGYKHINGVGGNTGFQKNDALAKFSIRSATDAKYQQELAIKLKYSDETSNETYMGLTVEDYINNPYSRYSASQKDQMNTEHKQLQINHSIDLSQDISLATVAYYNNFHRNWYKTSKVGGASLGKKKEFIIDGVTKEYTGIEIASLYDHNPSQNPIGQLPLTVDVKANNRDYLSQGIQTELYWALDTHELEFGLRYHEDQMDRFQWVDKYSLGNNQVMTLTDAGVPGTDSNRIDSAEAFAAFVQDRITIGNWNITAGLRYEDVETRRQDWGKKNSGRNGAPSKDLKNNFDAWLPSLGATYQINDALLVLAGVQKGFSPAAPGNAKAEEEKSWNYEAGLRYNQNSLTTEAIVFYSDYSNMHGNCTAFSGCSEENIGDQYNGGEVDIAGLELSGAYIINEDGDYSFPIKMSYTFTDSEFANSFESNLDTWGDVKKGYALAYLPEHQGYLSAGVATEQFDVTLAMRYTGKVLTKAGDFGHANGTNSIDSRTLFDLAAHYYISDAQQVYLTAENLFDETYVTNRVHGSIMVGKPRTVNLGYSYKF
ncbi:TonB-dependent receptor family protein [Shewanella marina]|uniref:TonB-dependent receptor family protein n=1 Tax=Shewanella marina TaxID=487319 RepID=UPI000A5DD7C3|nr:TonB-dependent receptor [Shewanella marina]